MWEARLWLALDHETPVDIVSTMGPDIEVEQLLELYFVAHPLVDWRETIRETGWAGSAGCCACVDSSASAECWVTMPQCRRPRGRRSRDRADRAAVAAAPRTHRRTASPRCSPVSLRRRAAPDVAVRRRQLKSGAGADGLLLEQSDVSSVANLGVNRLFRCVQRRGASFVGHPLQVRGEPCTARSGGFCRPDADEEQVDGRGRRGLGPA